MCDSDIRQQNGWKPKKEGPMYMLPRLSVDAKIEIAERLNRASALCGVPGVPAELRQEIEATLDCWNNPTPERNDRAA